MEGSGIIDIVDIYDEYSSGFNTFITDHLEQRIGTQYPYNEDNSLQKGLYMTNGIPTLQLISMDFTLTNKE